MPTLFVRMLLFGPMIYIAVIMLRDPTEFYQLTNKLLMRLQNFSNQLWMPIPVISSKADLPARQNRVLVRCAGAGLIAASFFYLIS